MRAFVTNYLISAVRIAIVSTCTAILFMPSAKAQNLVRNGDFSAGYAAFLSGYDYLDPVANALVPAGVFTVTRNPYTPIVLNDQGTGIFDFYDHAQGTRYVTARNIWQNKSRSSRNDYVLRATEQMPLLKFCVSYQ